MTRRYSLVVLAAVLAFAALLGFVNLTVFFSLIGLVLFKQRLDLPAVVGLAMIVGGVVVINLFSRAVSH